MSASVSALKSRGKLHRGEIQAQHASAVGLNSMKKAQQFYHKQKQKQKKT